ncbi:MAG: phosphatidylglycerophosphatase A [Helicobacteraceae bacterium]|nr:phosphatidylglycerophosphatase A [Helicobacteraceae bacterium]
MIKFFVTLFYSGLSPKASGTIGSIAAIPIAILLLYFIPIETFWLLIFLVFIAGAKAADIYMRKTAREDPKEVVIDELVGMWIAIAILPDFFNPIQIALAFIFFRVFDIKKPSVIGKIDAKLKNGYGVMLDDVLAGFFGGLAAALCVKIYELGGSLWN